MKDKLLRGLLILFCLTLSINLVRSYINLTQKGDVVIETKKKLQEAKDKQDQLKRELAMVESPEYIEKQAREKLNLGKEDEIVLILPSVSPFITPTPIPQPDFPTWRKWVNVFL